MTAFEFVPSGKLKLPSQEELLAADADSAILAYSRGTLDDGRPYWAYVAVKPSLYRTFCALSSAGESLVLKEYGTVLTAGYEQEAPAETVQDMREKYGADPDYLHTLIREADAGQDAFAAKREERRIMDIVTMLKKKQN